MYPKQKTQASELRDMKVGGTRNSHFNRYCVYAPYAEIYLQDFGYDCV